MNPNAVFFQEMKPTVPGVYVVSIILTGGQEQRFQSFVDFLGRSESMLVQIVSA